MESVSILTFGYDLGRWDLQGVIIMVKGSSADRGLAWRQATAANASTGVVMGVPMTTLGWAIEAPGCDGHGARYSMTLRPTGPDQRTAPVEPKFGPKGLR